MKGETAKGCVQCCFPYTSGYVLAVHMFKARTIRLDD